MVAPSRIGVNCGSDESGQVGAFCAQCLHSAGVAAGRETVGRYLAQTRCEDIFVPEGIGLMLALFMVHHVHMVWYVLVRPHCFRPVVYTVSSKILCVVSLSC